MIQSEPYSNICNKVKDPSNGLAANVSKDTTFKELKTIGDFDTELVKHKNINFMFGKVNHVDYVSTMFQAPTLEELKTMITEQTYMVYSVETFFSDLSKHQLPPFSVKIQEGSQDSTTNTITNNRTTS